jgi:hypothetical protein
MVGKENMSFMKQTNRYMTDEELISKMFCLDSDLYRIKKYIDIFSKKEA